MKKIIIMAIIMLLILIMLIWYKKNNSVDIKDLRTKQIIPWGIKNINVFKVWPIVNGKGVRVAVMDSGVYFQHPDFENKIKSGFNTFNTNELPIDEYGHGTLVSGIIMAQNNSLGIVGVAPNVDLYPVKVLDKYGEGDISNIANGIDWCIKNNIQIINMSFSINEDKPLLKESILKAVNAGIIVIASASNLYHIDNNNGVGYPASYKEVISVAGIDEKLMISENSTKGKIDFSAPGVNIISTYNDGNYKELSGNSFAAPYITGIVALILQDSKIFGLPKDKCYLNKTLYGILRSLSNDLGKRGKDNKFGYGFIAFKNKLSN
jgi:subtilisin family serine protease